MPHAGAKVFLTVAVKLVANEEGSRWPVPPFRTLGWVATADAVLVAVFALSNSSSELDTTGPADAGSPDGQGLSLVGQSLPAALSPGPQRTNNIAGGLSFNAPEGLIVVAEGQGELVLEMADEPRRSSGQLIIVETMLSDWQAEIGLLADSGDVYTKEIGATVAAGATTRLDVTVANEAVASRSCTIGEPCIRLDSWPSTGQAALWAGADNRIVEIGRTEDSVVLAIEISQRPPDPLSRLAALVINSACISTCD